MDHDVLRREKLTNEVSANIESTLTISLALKVAAKFSNGAAVMEGKGQLGKSYRGTFNICYWVQVEGLSKLLVVRFPLIRLLSIDTMTAKFSCEIVTLKFFAGENGSSCPGIDRLRYVLATMIFRYQS